MNSFKQGQIQTFIDELTSEQSKAFAVAKRLSLLINNKLLPNLELLNKIYPNCFTSLEQSSQAEFPTANSQKIDTFR